MIYFNSVKLHAQKNKKKLLEILERCIRRGVYLDGQENKNFSANLQKIYKKGFIVIVGSGHDALVLTLSSLYLTEDDEILFPVNAYPTAFAVGVTSGKQIPVDVDENGQIDVKSLKKKISSKTKVIIIVHLYGLVGNLDTIKKIANSNNITLIEDCAQAFGSKYKGELVGTFGEIACFSFYPTKNLASLGDGGAICAQDKKTYNFLMKAKSYGEKKRYNSKFIAGHSRLTEFQAGVLNLQLKVFNAHAEKRRKLYQIYVQKIRDNNLERYIRILKSDPNSDPVPHVFVVSAVKRDKLKKYLASKKIETHIHYPVPAHLLKAFSHLNYKKGDYPVAEKLSKEILSLPFHPYLTVRDIDIIVKTLKKFYG